MIKTHSDDPDVRKAAKTALGIINEVLGELAKAETYDYGGHILKVGEYGVCTICSGAIAETQAAERALLERAKKVEDETVREHLDIAAQLFRSEAASAMLRAELHNGQATEPILNRILGFLYDRHVPDQYTHSHHGAQE
jgi:hypothetical protein